MKKKLLKSRQKMLYDNINNVKTKTIKATNSTKISYSYTSDSYTYKCCEGKICDLTTEPDEDGGAELKDYVSETINIENFKITKINDSKTEIK